MYYFKHHLIRLLCAFFLVWLSGCTEQEAHLSSTERSPVCLSESMAEAVAVTEVKSGLITHRLRLPGEIAVHSDRVYRVYSMAGGVVSHVNVRLGDKVEKGEVLATIRSPEIAELNKDELAARARLDLAESTLRLVESLYESGVYSRRDLIQAQSALETARAGMEQIQQRKEMLGVLEGEAAYQIKAPKAGFVTDRNINPGVNIQAGMEQQLFTIADLDEVWVIGSVYESDIHHIRLHDKAEVTVPAWPGSLFAGEIVRISNAIDPNRRVLEVIIELPNPHLRLKPGMYATVEVDVPDTASLPSVHSEALIFDNNRYYVVTLKDECDLEARPVAISSYGGGRVFIGSGLDEGESVVLNGQLLLYNELIAKNKMAR